MLSSTKKISGFFDAPDFLQDLFGRPSCLGVSEVRLDGAELAAEMAAPSRFHESHRKVTLAGKDRAVRPQPRKRRTLCLLVDALQAARREIVQHAVPDPLRLADDDGFGVFARLVGHQGRMKSPHDDRNAAAAKLGSDLIRASGGVGFDAHRHQVRGLVVGNGFGAVVVEANVDARPFGGESGKRGRRKRLHLPGADVRLADSPADARMDERESHMASRTANAIASSGVSDPSR